MKSTPRFVASVCALAALSVAAQACGSKSSSSPSGPATEITVASVETGIGEFSSVMPICRKSGGQAPSASSELPPDASVWLEKAFDLHRSAAVQGGFTKRNLTSTKPADQMGECGGRITYPVYNHSNGTTTGTYAFQSYCSIDDDTGERVTLNGEMTFTNTGTPSSSGPITTKIEASSPAGITEVTKSPSGAQVSSRKIAFEDYAYTPGVPDGEPTSSKPDKLTAKSFSVTDQVTGKTYRQTDYSMTYFTTASGGEQMSVSGRGYRSNGESFEVSTSSPVTSNANGDFTGGAITFKGGNNTSAVLTVVPGSTLQGTMTVNGQPVTSVPVCK
ncbi:MAG TPA: hypothetical protein VLH75_00560 [Longimicrobiales bacterium]|nr:hypothetical protein [Longimicrobiales bacterium]